MKTDTGGPAFPVPSYVNSNGETFSSNIQGMTLLDWFAGQAMKEFLRTSSDCAWVASLSYEQAEAMIVEKCRREQ